MKFSEIVTLLLYFVVTISVIVWIIDDSVQHGINVLVPLGILILSRVERNSVS